MTHSIEEMADGIEYEAMRYERTAGKISTEVGKQECLRRVDYLRAAAKALRVWHAALAEIAREQSATTATEAADKFQQLARDALAAAVAGAGEG